MSHPPATVATITGDGGGGVAGPAASQEKQEHKTFRAKEEEEKKENQLETTCGGVMDEPIGRRRKVGTARVLFLYDLSVCRDEENARKSLNLKRTLVVGGNNFTNYILCSLN